MRVILVRTPRNGEYRASTAIFCCQARLPVVGLGDIQLRYWLRGVGGSCGDAQTTEADAGTEDGSPETDSGGPSPRTTSTQLTGQGEGQLVPAWSLNPDLLISPFCVGGYSAGYQKRNVDTILATKPVINNQCCLWDVQWWHRICGSSQPEEVHAWYCLDGQEPETGLPRDLR